LPGAVVGLSADLAHGPLDNGKASATYLRTIAKCYGEFDTADGSPFAQWQALDERLARERPEALIVWVADNVADATFLAMACDRLAGRREPLWRVQVREVDQRGLRSGSALTALRSYVAMYSPEQLAQQFAARELLSNEDRLLLVQDFARIRDTSGHLRRLESGRVVGVPVESCDPLLLTRCTGCSTSSAIFPRSTLRLTPAGNSPVRVPTWHFDFTHPALAKCGTVPSPYRAR
jgi:hypothetical protein